HRVTASAGCSSNTVVIVVQDTNPPVLNCRDLTFCTALGQCVATNNLHDYITANDDCGVVTVTFNPTGPFNLGTNSVTATATDLAGNTTNSAVQVIVKDYEHPQITCPSNIMVCANPSGTNIVTWLPPSASDNCAVTNITCNPPSGSHFPVGETTVTCTATDSSGNPSHCTFTVTVLKVDLTAADLDGTVAEANEDSPGAFVHWNLDNDDSSDNTSGAPKRPGADYLQTGAAKVTGENDLKSLAMALQPDMSQGTVVLTIGNAKAKIWKDYEKGSANLVLAGPGDKTWDLSDAAQKVEFVSLCSDLRVEGVDAGTCNIKLAYKNTSGTEVCSDTVKYTFIAADCGNQPTTTGNPSQRGRFEGTFPLMRCEWSVTHTNYPNTMYNCIAWSVDETGFWYEPEYIDVHYGNNDGIFDNSDMDAFYLAKKGWRPTASGPSDAQAMYYPLPNPWNYGAGAPFPTPGYHAARKKGCSDGSGKWIMFESKCGAGERIEHVWDQLNGSAYGSPARFYK
ncbi:MAG: HYR domain-containing protein, partial [Verrucomicrobiae bacterium]|nr:HYR domain-containing protein [Verrucomicrobiae bacterium]